MPKAPHEPSPAEWQDALNAIPLALAKAKIHEDGEYADSAHNAAVDALMSLAPKWDRARGTLRQYAFRSMCQAVKWSLGRQLEQRKLRAAAIHQNEQRIFASEPNAVGWRSGETAETPPAEHRFGSDELAKLPNQMRRAVILYIHLGLSLRETGLLLGGLSKSTVSVRLSQAASLLNLQPNDLLIRP